ncbi:metal-sulfur cluster assembly factor [Pyrobaculum aerophilum]|uniref:Metal-sulfur cluster biosynthetic enzyme n=1 Tax=Pyrobaculum aerophilum TaxID=13773 RepID=A0A371R5Q9_9CREN|nr:metal-sulfur cluster assembly factor [Pyrobaculum aerophilum]RFA97594.1 metal-sulfur cluster biosynthetic enzyme [Pyrobaculum aerophilum]RFA99349.1 metal-sulfur cluster biosynthetic enzyme [Pyrobaculum aerophilum]
MSLDAVVKALREVYDPEIPINIYDLGLIRDIKIENGRVKVKMLFTSGQMCPVAEMMAVQVKYAIKRALPDCQVDVEVDLNTQWTPAFATAEGRRALEEIFGKEYVEGLMKRKFTVRISRDVPFDPIAYMRENVEARYRVFKEWLERTKI